MRILIIILLTSFTFFSCNKKTETIAKAVPEVVPTVVQKQTPKKAKNVILMIGDGMGVSQITAGMYRNGNKTELERFPIVGLHKTQSSNKLITDSAAGATAFATGVKTYNGAISVCPDSIALATVLEEAEEKNLCTGLIANCSVTHATPASFIAHNKYRKNSEAIAEDFLDTEVDFVVGGGFKYFNRRESDDRNLVTELQNKGYVVKNYFDEEIEDITVDPTQNFIYFTADKEPLTYESGRNYLANAVTKGLDFLSAHDGNDGFFLMVEGSQIDWGGHANNANYVLTEFEEFDKVVGQVLDFAEKDGNTLVIVTADHETGGFAIQPESRMDSLAIAFTTNYHTAAMIPVFAYGPGAEKFSGIYENIAIYNKIREAYGWEDTMKKND